MATYEIGIAVWEGVEELDFAGPYEVLTAWARQSERDIRVRTIGRTDEPVTCAHGLRVIPDASWAEAGRLDLVLFPGAGTGPIVEDGAYIERVREHARSGTLMTSVCTGAFVLAQAGLLDGRSATTHWGSIDRLREVAAGRFTVDADARFVDEGEVVTAAGVSAGIDMALHLVARLESPDAARRVRRYIQYDPQPPV